MGEQYQMRRQGRKQRKEEGKLMFEIGKVFGPEAAKEEDFILDSDVGSYQAEHGQAGDRTIDERRRFYEGMRKRLEELKSMDTSKISKEEMDKYIKELLEMRRDVQVFRFYTGML